MAFVGTWLKASLRISNDHPSLDGMGELEPMDYREK